MNRHIVRTWLSTYYNLLYSLFQIYYFYLQNSMFDPIVKGGRPLVPLILFHDLEYSSKFSIFLVSSATSTKTFNWIFFFFCLCHIYYLCTWIAPPFLLGAFIKFSLVSLSKEIFNQHFYTYC